MALPIIPKKYFDVKSKFIPKGKVTLSPFSVGMETILLQTKDSTDEKEQISAIKQVIEYCMQTKNIDVGALPMFVIEEMFVRLMQNSVNDTLDLSYTCTADIDNKKCGNAIIVTIDLNEFIIKETAGHTNKVMIADPIGIQFKYPSIDMMDETENEMNTQCIDLIFDGDEVHSTADYSSTEIKEFWDQLTLPQKKEVYTKFFDSIPHMHYATKITCKKCGTVHPMEFNSVFELFL